MDKYSFLNAAHTAFFADLYDRYLVNPDSVELKNGFTRDVRGIGHFGTGDLEITIQSSADFEKAKPLLEKSYEVS